MHPALVNVVGSANVDLVMQVPKFPRPGETLLGGSFATFPGGKGANQAVACSRLGSSTRFIGCVGDDEFADRLLSSLQDSDVLVDGVERLPGLRTGVAAITVSESGENMIAVASGANFGLTPQKVKAELNRFPAAVVLVQLEIPMACVEAAILSSQGLSILNPAPAHPVAPEILRHVDVIVPNETEIEILTGIAPDSEENIHGACSELLAQGVGAVVLTRGAEGCVLAQGHRLERYRAPKVQAVDTTAAGDAFCGALAHFLALGNELESATSRAIVAASLSVTRAGAQPSMPTKDEYETFSRSISGDRASS